MYIHRSRGRGERFVDSDRYGRAHVKFVNVNKSTTPGVEIKSRNMVGPDSSRGWMLTPVLALVSMFSTVPLPTH